MKRILLLSMLLCLSCDGSGGVSEPAGEGTKGTSSSAGRGPDTEPDAGTHGGSRGHRCGGAVNSSGDAEAQCERDLWEPTGDRTMHCFAYGGSGDPCHLSNTNDLNDGLDKDPSLCRGDTFYLWDEPDTQGRDYAWAGRAWAAYAEARSAEIVTMRAGGTRITTPLIRAGDAGVIASNVDAFFESCGGPCDDPSDPAYVDIIAVNAFCGPWNGDDCDGGVAFIVDEVNAVTTVRGRPVYITNWGYLTSDTAAAQVLAIEAIDGFFVDGSPVERVYWFGARDFGGGTTNNGLTTPTTGTDGQLTTLGALWKASCDRLPE